MITSFEIPNANKASQSLGPLEQASKATPCLFYRANCSGRVNRLTFLDAVHTLDSNPWGKSTFQGLENSECKLCFTNSTSGEKRAVKNLDPFSSCQHGGTGELQSHWTPKWETWLEVLLLCMPGGILGKLTTLLNLFSLLKWGGCYFRHRTVTGFSFKTRSIP